MDSVELTYDKDLVLEALRSKDTGKIKKAINTTLSSVDDLVKSATKMKHNNSLVPEKLIYLMHDNCNSMGGAKGGFKGKK